MVLAQVTQRQIHPYTRTYCAINVASGGKKKNRRLSKCCLENCFAVQRKINEHIIQR